MPVTREQLVKDLSLLGLRPGLTVMLHSSLSALGPVAGGADTVVEALREALGAEGTLLVPAFRDSVWGDRSDFTNSDCDCTSANGLCPSQQPGFQGVIPATVRRRPGSLRSCHPTHSWVGLGPRAERLLRGHRRSPSSCGAGNPFEEMGDQDVVLLLGVGVDRATLWHYYEELLPVPYAGHFWPKERHLNNTVAGLRLQYEFPGVLQDVCRAAGIASEGRVGKSRSSVLEVGTFKRFMAAVLADNLDCMVLRPPDRVSPELAVDALRKAEGMLAAWRSAERRGAATLPAAAVAGTPLGPVPIPNRSATVREDCPAFAGWHDCGASEVSLCAANLHHPELYHPELQRRGEPIASHGVTTCATCSWHSRYPPLS